MFALREYWKSFIFCGKTEIERLFFFLFFVPVLLFAQVIILDEKNRLCGRLSGGKTGKPALFVRYPVFLHLSHLC